MPSEHGSGVVGHIVGAAVVGVDVGTAVGAAVGANVGWGDWQLVALPPDGRKYPGRHAHTC